MNEDRTSSTITSKKKIMTMKRKTNKNTTSSKVKGFMCQNSSTTPSAALFVCGANDLPRTSAIVPASRRRLLLDKNNIKYSSTAAGNFKYSRLPQQQQQVQAGEPLKSKKKSIDDHKIDHKLTVRHDHHPNARHSFQVVVMRVSLHCQGCAGQVKRHLSKMEGVTSFSIDLETQRVTVMGHVSPLVVLQSISKVKKAQLWPTSPSPSSSS